MSLTPDEIRIEGIAMMIDGHKVAEGSATALRKLDYDMLAALLGVKSDAEIPTPDAED